MNDGYPRFIYPPSSILHPQLHPHPPSHLLLILILSLYPLSSSSLLTINRNLYAPWHITGGFLKEPDLNFAGTWLDGSRAGLARTAHAMASPVDRQVSRCAVVEPGTIYPA